MSKTIKESDPTTSSPTEEPRSSSTETMAGSLLLIGGSDSNLGGLKSSTILTHGGGTGESKVPHLPHALSSAFGGFLNETSGDGALLVCGGYQVAQRLLQTEEKTEKVL